MNNVILMDGKQLLQETKAESKEINSKRQVRSRVKIMTISPREDNKRYILNKKNAIESSDMFCDVAQYDDSFTTSFLVDVIREWNKDPFVTHIMVQLPVPENIDVVDLLSAISPEKDIDCLNSITIGVFNTLDDYYDSVTPCTPYGIVMLLQKYEIDVRSKNVLVIGRSNIVGKPMAQLMTKLDATVTLAHSKTPESDLIKMCEIADIIIVAVGQAKFLTRKHLETSTNKKVVVDVGINFNENNKMVGDVDFDNVIDYCSHITPVPGGVGPCTVAAVVTKMTNWQP